MIFLRKHYLQIIILFFATLEFIAAFTLTVEKIALIKAPEKILSCTINATFNCATIMKTPHVELFGFPNSLLGFARSRNGFYSSFVFAR